MAVFDSISISGSGMTLHRKYLDAVSDNIANINTAAAPDQEAFKERFIVAQAVDYGSGSGGVRVAGAAFGSAEGKLVYSPDNPLADDEGYVRMPDIDLGTQMTNLIIAQRGYQANISAISRATDAYQAALQLGKNL
ncbi:flagellar basal-body rod protein FlgC [Geodermatophilus sp. Leaf369]|jgi:flagellar basal-body rod protein FlgC|uniref:flagellar basal body rod protein FlgC n=1 Tax=Geodermatophilus sp. Leaf369 TaxID=1736354 RepID=UPI0006FDF9E9|nr:flagellar basal body rod C-terminal domain-containing protein [Geodermatophilus sp. Leaf369]KQS60277.1 flagellar basal-body rod protein FlgC [Geodermatophilus sp. Leaf369]QNG37659.1 flagellar basal-body rod protein FlgC [Geodermatophilaceae bacterium NBWT11]